MSYDMLHRILGTLLAYYTANRESLTAGQVKDIAEQIHTVTRQMMAIVSG